MDRSRPLRAVGVDPVSGALLVDDPAGPANSTNPAPPRAVIVGEIRHVRLTRPALTVAVADGV